MKLSEKLKECIIPGVQYTDIWYSADGTRGYATVAYDGMIVDGHFDDHRNYTSIVIMNIRPHGR